MRFEYGILLPHFGQRAQRDRLLNSARAIERYGFDRVFARDHLVYRPRPLEAQEPDFLDTFVVLSAVAAVTERVMLGTAVQTPHRNPIHAAQIWGSLSRLAGAGRIFPMWGLGALRTTDAAGMVGWDRAKALAEYIGIIRTLWKGGVVDHDGEFYKFKGVSVSPVPDPSTPMWYGGPSLAAVRRAVELFDGYSAGQMPGKDFAIRHKRLEKLCAEAGRETLPSCISSLVSPGRTVEEGARYVPIASLSKDFEDRFTVPASGHYETLADFTGAVIVGPPEEIVAGVRGHQRRGAQLVIFDLRLRNEDWEDAVAAIGEEVLPILHREDGRAG